MTAFATFARACLLALALAPAARGQGLEELEHRLADSNERVRRKAVEELSHQSGAAAMELIVKCLRDPSAMVADEAQLALGSADEPAELEVVFSKDALGAKDDLVRLRCAEALGRIQAKLPSARLAKALSDKDARVRRAVAYSIEQLAGRLGLAESPPALLRKELASMLAKDPARDVRAAALMALGAVEPGWTAAELLQFSGDKAFEVRSASVRAALGEDGPARLELARRGIADASASVRLQSVRLAEVIASRDSAVLLAEGLGAEKSSRAAWSMVQALRRLSGLKAGRDARYWAQWAGGLAADWKPGSGKPPPADSELTTTTFAGLPLCSDGIVFLIDLSGSMWEERDGKTRKAGAEKELELALKQLAASVHFNLIPFTLAPLPWQKALLPAEPKSVASALAFFEQRNDSGKGNFWDALQLALEDPEVDTVVLLGDGAPTGGTRWNVELMRILFEEQNRFRLVELDAVLVDCSKGLTKTWTEWCESTGGRTRSTELR